MIYRTNALSFSLLLGAGGVAVSVAATLPCNGRCEIHHKVSRVTPQLKTRIVYKQWSRLRLNLTQEIRRSILDELTSSSDEVQGSTPNYIDSGTPSPGYAESPADVDLNDPFGSLTGWLNHEGRAHNTLGVEGELDLIANSDEKPTGVRIGTLGYASDRSDHSPFELLPETEAGAVVFLAPPELATGQISESFDPDADFSNHSMAMLLARSTPLGLGLLPNLNLTSASSSNAPGATEPSGLVHVIIKAGSSASNSSPDNLCATFYSHSTGNRTEDDPPMFLERCDNSFIPGPGSLSSSLGFAATQLWQYDPKTHELKPILQTESEMNNNGTPLGKPISKPSATASVEGTNRGAMIPQSFSSSGEHAGTTTQYSAFTQQLQGYTSSGTSPTSSSEVARPSQVNVRRGQGSHMEANGPVSPMYKVIAIVEPYTLVFVPRTALGAGAKVPDSSV